MEQMRYREEIIRNRNKEPLESQGLFFFADRPTLLCFRGTYLPRCLSSSGVIFFRGYRRAWEECLLGVAQGDLGHCGGDDNGDSDHD